METGKFSRLAEVIPSRFRGSKQIADVEDVGPDFYDGARLLRPEADRECREGDEGTERCDDGVHRR